MKEATAWCKAPEIMAKSMAFGMRLPGLDPGSSMLGWVPYKSLNFSRVIVILIYKGGLIIEPIS